MAKTLIIKDETTESKARFISFKKRDYRFDLLILDAEQFGTGKMVLDLNSKKMATLDQKKINQKGFLEHEFQLHEIKADALRDFLLEVF